MTQQNFQGLLCLRTSRFEILRNFFCVIFQIFLHFLKIMQVWYRSVQHVKDINAIDVFKANFEFD